MRTRLCSYSLRENNGAQKKDNPAVIPMRWNFVASTILGFNNDALPSRSPTCNNIKYLAAAHLVVPKSSSNDNDFV